MTFDSYREKIDQAILDHFSSFKSDSVLKEASLYALMSGGRRIRPIISLLVSEGLGCDESIALIPALAIEFFHTASLIADDLPCMDDDDYRRGQPSTHAKFGQATAILTTYALIAEGYGLLSRLQTEHIPILLKETTTATGFLGASEGQLQDLNQVTNLEEMIQKKTGSLFELAFIGGWIVGNGSIDQLPEVRKAASYFGTAFQVYDDIQDRHDLCPNLANTMGLERAKEMLHFSMEQFSLTLKGLNLSHSKLELLSSLSLAEALPL